VTVYRYPVAMAEGKSRVLLTIFDRRQRAYPAEHRVQAPPTALVSELIGRLAQRMPALAGCRGLLDAAGMAPVDPGATLAGAMLDGQLKLSFDGEHAGRVLCVGCWDDPIFVHVPNTHNITVACMTNVRTDSQWL
jgi:hypothetical protein